MALNAHDQDGLRQYLLRQLAEDQQELTEKRLFTDDEFFEELEIAEDELSDDYVSNELTPDQRRRFEQFFLISPERQGKLRFARALARQRPPASTDEPTWIERIRLVWHSQTPLIRAAAVAAAVVIVAGALWFARPDSSPQTFATLTLTISTADRAAGVPATKLTLPIQGDGLRLKLKLPEQSRTAARYRVDMQKANGGTQPLAPVLHDGDSLVVELPAAQLSRGEYAFKVSAINPDGSDRPLSGSYLLTVE
jgi:hypothetical protein